MHFTQKLNKTYVYKKRLHFSQRTSVVINDNTKHDPSKPSEVCSQQTTVSPNRNILVCTFHSPYWMFIVIICHRHNEEIARRSTVK
jgi:hypothetical protein